jgi:hypothetical protein
MLKVKIEKKNSNHEISITLRKANWKKVWTLISKQLNIERWNWKKKLNKKKFELLEGKIEKKIQLKRD